jgi:hypothetical protein
MHLDDTPIKVVTEVIVLGKLLKEIVLSKPARHFGRSLFKKIFSVPRGISFLKKSESRRHSSSGVRLFRKITSVPRGMDKTSEEQETWADAGWRFQHSFAAALAVAVILHDLGYSSLLKKQCF